jgi:hypothetical protein
MNWICGYELIFGLSFCPIGSDPCYRVGGAGLHLMVGLTRGAGQLSLIFVSSRYNRYTISIVARAGPPCHYVEALGQNVGPVLFQFKNPLNFQKFL